MAPEKLKNAFRLFDEANAKDPNVEVWQGKEYPKELLYAMRMTEKLESFDPDAPESLQLTARCQHIRRWEIPRESYEMNRAGYLKWRQDLKKFHAGKAGDILREQVYDEEIISMLSYMM